MHDTDYNLMCRQLESLIEGVSSDVANLANASSLLYQSIDEINWAGFYIVQDDALILGPFQGRPACVRIEMGHGVCGTAAAERRTVLVENVHDFPGHIACDSASESEIVVPLCNKEKLYGVMDIDSPVRSRFNLEDREGLERFAGVLMRGLFRE